MATARDAAAGRDESFLVASPVHGVRTDHFLLPLAGEGADYAGRMPE